MTQSGIEPGTFRFVAQRLNHCATVQSSSLKRNKFYAKIGEIIYKVQELVFNPE